MERADVSGMAGGKQMNIDSFKASVPWQAKIAAKLILSRLPLGYVFWQKRGLFKHGYMENPDYAYGAFRSHFDRSTFAAKSGPFVCLELGPGDTLFSALIAKALGASRTYMVDTGHYCRRDAALYRRMSQHLVSLGHTSSVPADCEDLNDILNHCNGEYLTNGVDSLRDIPTASVDWIWSQAVLEHVRRRDFPTLMKELRRILKPDGICSHGIDLQDHLGGALNNLRYSEATWESEWMASSGFYTNRIRFAEMCEMFRNAGFAVETVSLNRWHDLPTPRAKLAEPFSRMAEEDLLVLGFDALLRPVP